MNAPQPTVASRSWALVCEAYGLAIAVTVATLLLRLALEPWASGRLLLILFLIPIIVSSYFGGLGPGLVATAASVLGADYFIIPPTHSLAIARGVDVTQCVILVLCGVLASALNEALQRARRRTGGPGALPDLQSAELAVHERSANCCESRCGQASSTGFSPPSGSSPRTGWSRSCPWIRR